MWTLPRQFRDSLKQEIRLLKQEVDLLPKEKRKDEFRKRKTAMEIEHEEREKSFLSTLSENHELALRRISEIYREKLSAADKGYLQQKQTVELFSLSIFNVKMHFWNYHQSRLCELERLCCGSWKRNIFTININCRSDTWRISASCNDIRWSFDTKKSLTRSRGWLSISHYLSSIESNSCFELFIGWFLARRKNFWSDKPLKGEPCQNESVPNVRLVTWCSVSHCEYRWPLIRSRNGKSWRRWVVQINWSITLALKFRIIASVVPRAREEALQPGANPFRNQTHETAWRAASYLRWFHQVWYCKRQTVNCY